MTTAGIPLRPVIAASWHRAALGGLRPADSIDSRGLADIDPRSRLRRAAEPVLDEVALALTGTEFAVVLADRESRLVDLRCGAPAVLARMEALGLVLGRTLAEEAVGTNSIATAIEVGAGVAVHGEEHFLDALKQFSCFGHPIYHPVTRALEGVVDITCATTEVNPLLAPLAGHVSRQIEKRLLGGARAGDRHLLEAFQSATLRERCAPVVALSGDLLLANEPAVELLTASDHAMLRGIAADARRMRDRRPRLRLNSGGFVTASVLPAADGAVLTLTPAPAKPVVALPVRKRAAVAICGEPGSGCTRAARDLLSGSERVEWFDASDIAAHGEREWSSMLRECLIEATPVVVEAVHLLPPTIARQLAALMRATPARVVLTSAPLEHPAPEVAALLAHCMERIDLEPLRARVDAIPELVASMLADMRAPRELRFTPAAFEALASQPWPGNIRELRAVVECVAETRSVGDIAVRDLPERYRSRSRARLLTPMERAEAAAISKALRVVNGNKQAAAAQLGISRSTLYRAIRRYGIVAPEPG